jgi:hypothetical protein
VRWTDATRRPSNPPEAMKLPTTASLKKVSPENLARLGAERLAEILVEAADTRPDLKRRLRMELAAEQGADHLALEIDKRLASLETSRGKVSWRKRASFVGDLDTLRTLISERLAGLDPAMALARMWLFMDLARRPDEPDFGWRAPGSTTLRHQADFVQWRILHHNPCIIRVCASFMMHPPRD